MSYLSAFKTPEGEASFLAAYDAALKEWPVPHEEVDVPTRFGTTHVVVCGSKTSVHKRCGRGCSRMRSSRRDFS
jgi:hypothetical protein